MDEKNHLNKAISKEWQLFKENNNLTDSQIDKFKIYYDLLSEWNDRINLTRIVELQEVLDYHFSDSLILEKHLDFKDYNSIADIGSGGGFPGIPLKIKYPHLKVTLIEVVGKKVLFLNEVINQIGLNDIQVLQMDWRTFLRTSTESVDLFCARASLQVPELLRIFKPSSSYQDSLLVYWASNSWTPENEEEEFISQVATYDVGDKKRKLIFFSK